MYTCGFTVVIKRICYVMLFGMLMQTVSLKYTAAKNVNFKNPRWPTHNDTHAYGTVLTFLHC